MLQHWGSSNMEKISVIVPTYNQAPYLGACLDSIFFQDYPNLEIIVVDDGSTDETQMVLEVFADQVEHEAVSYASNFNSVNDEIERTVHPRYPKAGRELIVLNNGRNLGSTRTYNRGFKAATGKYCTYIASDDMCHPQMISSLAAVLDRDEADFVYSDMFIIDDRGRILRQFDLPDYSFADSFCRWYLCGVSKLYRRALHESYGYFNEDYLANDHECYLRFAMQGARFKHIAKVLYSVRSHKKRQEHVHSRANWSRLLRESCELVAVARNFANSRNGEE
jgi:glycosyltransferase involved in cell wall biosynthesis